MHYLFLSLPIENSSHHTLPQYNYITLLTDIYAFPFGKKTHFLKIISVDSLILKLVLMRIILNLEEVETPKIVYIEHIKN